MVLGINATLITLTNGTTANAPDVLTDLQNINNGGISNDGISTTDGSGNVTFTSVATTVGGVIHGITPITPYSLASNITINNGVTNTYTCTGVGGVPAGAKAVFMNLWFLGSALGTYATVTPHGTAEATGNYPAIGATANTTVYCLGSFLAILDGAGKIDVGAVNGNCQGLYLQMYAYVY